MPGKNLNRGARRERLAHGIADMLLSMKTGDRSATDIIELTELYPETFLPWIDAFKSVGLLVDGAPAKKRPGQPGQAARTWRMP